MKLFHISPYRHPYLLSRSPYVPTTIMKDGYDVFWQGWPDEEVHSPLESEGRMEEWRLYKWVKGRCKHERGHPFSIVTVLHPLKKHTVRFSPPFSKWLLSKNVVFICMSRIEKAPPTCSTETRLCSIAVAHATAARIRRNQRPCDQLTITCTRTMNG